jgi:hypothetical protein
MNFLLFLLLSYSPILHNLRSSEVFRVAKIWNNLIPVTMYFSRIVLTVLTGTAAASSYLPELNSTELRSVLVGAGPVITEITTVTEILAAISMRTPHYMWLHKPIPFTRVPTSSAISEEQIRGGDLIRAHHPLIASPPPARALLNGTTLVRTHKHRSTALTAEPATSQPATTTTKLCGVAMDPKRLRSTYCLTQS